MTTRLPQLSNAVEIAQLKGAVRTARPNFTSKYGQSTTILALKHADSREVAKECDLDEEAIIRFNRLKCLKFLFDDMIKPEDLSDRPKQEWYLFMHELARLANKEGPPGWTVWRPKITETNTQKLIPEDLEVPLQTALVAYLSMHDLFTTRLTLRDSLESYSAFYRSLDVCLHSGGKGAVEKTHYNPKGFVFGKPFGYTRTLDEFSREQIRSRYLTVVFV